MIILIVGYKFQITVPQEERRDDEKMYNKKTVADLQKIAPFVSGYFLLELIKICYSVFHGTSA